MKSFVSRLRQLVPAIWLGLLICVAFVAAPAAFDVLERSQAARYVAALFRTEAKLSLGLALWVVLSCRHGPRASVWLALGVMALTLFSQEVVTPWMQAARLGQATPGQLSVGQWHAVSMACFAIKLFLVAVLAWRSTEPASARDSSDQPTMPGGPSARPSS